jgi:hypothetical protein
MSTLTKGTSLWPADDGRRVKTRRLPLSDFGNFVIREDLVLLMATKREEEAEG